MFQTFYIMSHWNTRNHTKITLKYKLYWTFFSADGQERGYLLLHRWGQRSPSQNCDRAWFSAPDPGVTAKNDSSVNISYKTMTPLRNSGGARAILHGGKLGPDQIHGGQMWLCNWDDSANRADVWGQSEGKLNFRGGGKCPLVLPWRHHCSGNVDSPCRQGLLRQKWNFFVTKHINFIINKVIRWITKSPRDSIYRQGFTALRHSEELGISRTSIEYITTCSHISVWHTLKCSDQRVFYLSYHYLIPDPTWLELQTIF